MNTQNTQPTYPLHQPQRPSGPGWRLQEWRAAHPNVQPRYVAQTRETGPQRPVRAASRAQDTGALTRPALAPVRLRPVSGPLPVDDWLTRPVPGPEPFSVRRFLAPTEEECKPDLSAGQDTEATIHALTIFQLKHGGRH